jgi:uncharacterized protein YbjT (DUF2867 family)
MKSKTFVVAGATGRQGGATARHLIKSGNKVIGITHTPSKVQKLESIGVIPLVADLRDATKLIPHLKGVDGFYLVTTPFDRTKETNDINEWVKDEVLQGQQALEAAHKTDVPHVVFSSVTHVGSDEALEKYGLSIHKTKIPIEKHARELGLFFTSLRPPFFMDDWVPNMMAWNRWVKEGIFAASVKSDTPIPAIATDNIGRIAAWTFDHPNESIGQAWEIVGEVTTYPSICHALSEHYHRPIIFKEVSQTEDDFPFHRALLQSVYAYDAGQWERKFGFKMTTFEEFLTTLGSPP